ncbi:hypothetical protein AHAS_Ahas17G0206100 [Arachis hypogaea]
MVDSIKKNGPAVKICHGDIISFAAPPQHGDVNRVTAQQKHAIEDLNERLSASIYAEAYAIISSQKVNIAELKEQLDDEQTQRKDEREKATTDLKAAESERERCLLVETLRSKLVRQLETELHEEKLTTANQTKKIEELEEETRRLSKELESEKVDIGISCSKNVFV